MEAKIENPYIASKWYDYSFFILSPIAAILVGVLGEIATEYLQDTYPMFKQEETNPYLLFGVSITIAHLFLVFFRSHLNQKIFKEFPIRFTFIPAILFMSMTISPYILAFVSIVITWWDVYHSGLQTFGIGRIYDAKYGNDSNAGRRMDYFLNLFIYAGPILGGVTFIDHFMSDIKDWRVLSKYMFTKGPDAIYENTPTLAIIFGSLGVIFLVGYLYHYNQLKKEGYRYPPLKLTLFASTALTSILVWGLNPFGNAFFIMNLFHAVQYYAIVYYFEKKNMATVLKIEKKPWKNIAIIAILLIVSFTYGIVSDPDGVVPSGIYLYAFHHTVSVMHFWYDGFIWSVRKKHV